MKTFFDYILSLFLLIVLSPVIIVICIIIFLTDFNNPFYISNRVGLNFKQFQMIKFRSMIIDADKNKVFSTKSDDERLTKIGKFVRKFKLDELPQLINVLRGQMSFVGPRPNVLFEVKQYYEYEKKLLNVKPGITDLASIVFSDEAEILENSEDPNKDYSLLIRPWKSKLGNFYIENKDFILDLKIITFTLLNFLNRGYVLRKISNLIKHKSKDNELAIICLRKVDLRDMINANTKS